MRDKHKILYVDDEVINLQIFELTFKNNYNILTAQSGQKGLEIIAKENDIKVVISDMRMPVMNGLEFIKSAKEIHPSVKFYILTGYDINEEIQEALDDGLILKYFKKPFNMDEIVSTINNSLEA